MDPITLDICWSPLVGVVNEQAAALMRTSFTSIVREAEKKACATARAAMGNGGAGSARSSPSGC
jgi:N-methylhydantoinase B